MINKVWILAIAVAWVSGCAATDPYAFEQQQRVSDSAANPMTRFVLGLPAADSKEPVTGPMDGTLFSSAGISSAGISSAGISSAGVSSAGVFGAGGRAAGNIAASGSGAEYYMQQQELLLKAELGAAAVKVERQGTDIRVLLPGEATFASGSDQLQADFLPVLETLASVVRRFDQTRLEIMGYTDSQGRAEYNRQLSLRRAEAVANQLTSAGVDQGRIRSTGLGEQQPLASNDTAAGRAINRRVELLIQAAES